jgi:pyruvate dehydrogenase E2 component (dihydrolipoamide acetyltransferase)
MKRKLRLPDLGLGDQPITLSVWFMRKGEVVAEGEPVVEVAADSVTVDIPSPIDGVLVRKLVAAGDRITIGQEIAVIEAEEDFE